MALMFFFNYYFVILLSGAEYFLHQLSNKLNLLYAPHVLPRCTRYPLASVCDVQWFGTKTKLWLGLSPS